MNGGVKKYTVTILNDSYALMSDESELRVMAAASRVDTLMRELSAKGLDPKRAAVLSALKVSMELVMLKEEASATEAIMTSLINELNTISI